MKILALSNCRLDPVLGSGRTRRAWAQGLAQLGHEVTLIDSEDLLGAAEHRPTGRRVLLAWRAHRWLAAQNLSTYDLIEFYGSEFWLATQRLARLPREHRPLLVAHTDGLEFLMKERLCASGDPSARPLWWKALPSALMARIERLAFSRSDGFITGCHLDRLCLRRLGLGCHERMEVVHPGLEEEYFDRPLHTEGREDRVVFVGSWIARKGVRHLAAVMATLLRARPGLRLDLFGRDADDRNPLEDFPPEVHGQIILHPRVPQSVMVAALERAKVYFFPSEYEGFGLGLAEAMACGCAAVSTPTGLGAELRDGEEALICPFGDAAAMEAAIARLLDDEPFRARVAEAGWRRVQDLRWETSVRKLEAIYLRWLGEDYLHWFKKTDLPLFHPLPPPTDEDHPSQRSLHPQVRPSSDALP
jgi:glycosyltransferase involved in cell wall biosynthesis